MTQSEDRRRAKKKLRREARRRGENVQKRSRIRWTFAIPDRRIVKICWDCAGTGVRFVQAAKPHYRPCADCDGVGGLLSI